MLKEKSETSDGRRHELTPMVVQPSALQPLLGGARYPRHLDTHRKKIPPRVTDPASGVSLTLLMSFGGIWWV